MHLFLSQPGLQIWQVGVPGRPAAQCTLSVSFSFSQNPRTDNLTILLSIFVPPCPPVFKQALHKQIQPNSSMEKCYTSSVVHKSAVERTLHPTKSNKKLQLCDTCWWRALLGQGGQSQCCRPDRVGCDRKEGSVTKLTKPFWTELRQNKH